MQSFAEHDIILDINLVLRHPTPKRKGEQSEIAGTLLTNDTPMHRALNLALGSFSIDDGSGNVTFKMNSRFFFQTLSRLFHSTENVKFLGDRNCRQLSSRVVTAKKCTKKHDARAKIKVTVLLIKPIAFLTFSLPSPSSLLKLPINLHMHATSTVRQSRSLNLTVCVETHWYVLRLD